MRFRPRFHAETLGLLTVLLLLPAETTAYRTYTTYSQGSIVPTDCEKTQPRKLRWTGDIIPYWLEPAPISNPLNAEQAAIQAFLKWELAEDCLHPSFLYMGLNPDPTQGGTMPAVGYNAKREDQNQNLVLWVTSEDGWTHEPGILGLTRLTFGACSGTIYDADIELNAAAFEFSAQPIPPPNTIDVQNTLTHEVGHLLGLDHSYVFESTMFPQAPEAETEKRDLTEDDIAGVCCIYQEGAPIVLPEAICETGIPRSETETEEGGDDGGGTHDPNGCSSSHLPSTTSTFYLLLFGLALIACRQNRATDH